jgi:hypothetical protein
MVNFAMPTKVSDYARNNAISVSRVHQLVADGHLPATRDGHWWMIDDAVTRFVPVARPLAEDNAWVLLQALDSGQITTDNRSVRFRTKAMIRRLETDSNPPALLRSWVARRADIHRFPVSIRSIRILRVDTRVRRQFSYHVGDKRRGGQDLSGYVTRRDLAFVVRDNKTVEGSRVNLTLRVADSLWPAQARSRYTLMLLDDWERGISSARPALADFIAARVGQF